MIPILLALYEKIRVIAIGITSNPSAINIDQEIEEIARLIRSEYYAFCRQKPDLEDRERSSYDLEEARFLCEKPPLITDHNNYSCLTRQHNECPRITHYRSCKYVNTLEDANRQINLLYNTLDAEIEAHEVTQYQKQLLWKELYVSKV